MAMDEDDAKEIKDMMGMAKRGPVNFGFCMGKSGEEAVLILHRSRSAGMLARNAKGEGETTRIVSGVLTVKGNRASFALATKPHSGLRKQIKGCLRAIGLQLKVTLLGPDGEEV